MIFIAMVSCTDNDPSSGNLASEDTSEVMEAIDPYIDNTSNFRGVNWADTRDNFVDSWLLLSGLETTDDVATVATKAENIYAVFQSHQINTVRLPINPATVLQNWWQQHAKAISTGPQMGFKVILAYWEGSSARDGKVDNQSGYWTMWDKVVAKYIGNQNIYFELMNEPYGYTEDELKTLYEAWLLRYPDVPKWRVVLDGVGYATGVNEIGADSRFEDCLLSFHYYTWFNGAYQTTADWELPVKNINYPERTIMTEFGVPMTNGKEFMLAPETDNEVTYLQGITTALSDKGMGSIYWPGIRTDDSYSMFTYTNGNVIVNNNSGLERLHVAWNLQNTPNFYLEPQANAFYKIINRNSGKSVDVSGGATTNGANVIQWDFNGGDNQQWSFTGTDEGYFNITNKNSNKALDVNGASHDAGTEIIQWDYADETNQQWLIKTIGFGYYTIINRNSNQSLDVNGGATYNGGDIIQWYYNNGYNQQWYIIAP